MRFSNLAPLLVLLLKEFGEVSPEGTTYFQEDCAGRASLTTAVRAYGIPPNCRDATWQRVVAFVLSADPPQPIARLADRPGISYNFAVR